MKSNEQNPPKREKSPIKWNSYPPLPMVNLKSYQPVTRRHFRRHMNTCRTGGLRNG